MRKKKKERKRNAYNIESSWNQGLSDEKKKGSKQHPKQQFGANLKPNRKWQFILEYK